VVQFIKGTRLEWAGYVWRADGRIMKKTMNQEMEKTRKTTLEMNGQCTRDYNGTHIVSEVDWNTSYDRERWKGLVIAAESINGL